MHEDINITRVQATEESAQRISNFLENNFWPEHSLDGITSPKINREKGENHIRYYLKNGAVFNSYHKGKIVGTVAVGPYDLWWSNQPALGDGWFYVLPEYRGKFNGNMPLSAKLVQYAVSYANEVGLPLLMGVFNAESASKLDSFFGENGFIKVGGIFMKGNFIEEAPNVSK
jgi:GNAT superfamily N-acetyltransferase